MHKYFTIIGFMILIILSFIITDKTANMVLDNDKLIITIKEKSPSYYIEALDGIIDNNTFIPGISGKEVNIKGSYKEMKKYGIFTGSLLKYNEIKPNNQLKDNYDKYIISGNPQKKMVSLIFLVHGEDDITNILNILNEKGISSNFFIDGYWFEDNKDKLLGISSNNHIIGNLSYNENYNDGAYIWMDTIIKKIGKQNVGYCYVEEENEENLRICALNKNYTIKPGLILKNDFLKQIKKNLSNGLIISIDVNNNLVSELPVIINYIASKGYEINNLNELLNEKTLT